jgi:hypothetical protein
MVQIVFRFVLGGFIVSLFAALGGVFKPKSFAGLFGAAPSVALATLGLTILTEGKAYAAIEARSMIAGAFSFCLYAAVCSHTLIKHKVSARVTTVSALALWLICALGIWVAVFR